jgi:lysophospholipase L1-like esterase
MPIRISVLVCALGAALVLPATAGAAERLYVSLGDSYATGYQATAPGKGRATRKGYANLLVREARKRGHDFRLVNFGCGGETATSILKRRKACGGPAVGGPRYAGRTQVAAATRFLRRNRGKVGLVTISIGGNDVTRCVGEADPVACVAEAVETVERKVRTLAKRVRKAAGPKVRIVGLTYPDVVLGDWVKGNQDLARLSVVAFRDLLNPALKERYEAVGGRFVDVTAATGAYGSLDELVAHDPYGEIPRPVADVCRLTYYCEFGDIHARTSGYRLIAELIAATLPRRG